MRNSFARLNVLRTKFCENSLPENNSNNSTKLIFKSDIIFALVRYKCHIKVTFEGIRISCDISPLAPLILSDIIKCFPLTMYIFKFVSQFKDWMLKCYLICVARISFLHLFRHYFTSGKAVSNINITFMSVSESVLELGVFSAVLCLKG